jgi:hypothetical protein
MRCRLRCGAGKALEKHAFEEDVAVTFGWALGRDAAQLRPAHTWDPMKKTRAELEAAAAGMLTHGLIANLDHTEGKGAGGGNRQRRTHTP